jgi:imidazolonepropionase-like amidohydrolase
MAVALRMAGTATTLEDWTMRTERTLTTALLLAALALPAVAHDYVPGPPQETPILLRGGTVHTVSGDVLANADVLFENGRITAVGAGLAAPDNAEIVDVGGKHVYPGLIAPATVIGLREIDAVRAMRDDAEVGSVTPEVRTHTAWNPDSEIIPTVRSNGIAVAQVAPRGSMIQGQSFITHLDGWTKEDAAVRLEDGLWLSWPAASLGALSDGKSRDNRLTDLEKQRQQIRQAFDDARAYQKRLAHGERSPVDLRWEAMIPVLEGKMTLYVVANDYRQIVDAIAFAAAQNVRIVIVGGRESARAATQLAAAGIPVIVDQPTALPSRQDDGYDQTYRTPAMLEAAGVKYCLAVMGSWQVRNLPLEAGHAIGWGLTRDQALRAVTLSAAEILGVDDELGSIEAGKRATIVVSEGDILDTLGHRVTHMWIDGRAVDLDDHHKELWRKYRQKP